MEKILRRIGDFSRDTSGNVLPLAAAGVIVLAGMIGGAVDMSRAMRAQNKLQAACDAGVLAGRRAVTTSGFDAAAQTQASEYFNVNFDADSQSAQNTLFTPTSNDSGNTVTAAATAQIDMTIMRILGVAQMNVKANCQASMGVGNSDVMMVLDNTGSMDWTLPGGTTKRIQALRSAMKNFYDTVHTATSSSNARIRYGFVPFSSSVNVGELLYDLNPAYLVDSHQVQSREASFSTSVEEVFTGWETAVVTTGSDTSSIEYEDYTSISSTKYSSKSNCLSGIAADVDWANFGDATTTTSTTINELEQQVVTTTVTQPQRKTEYTCFKSGSRWYRYRRYLYRDQLSYSYATSDPIYTEQITTAFDRWNYKPVTYDVSGYKTGAAVSVSMGTNGAALATTWEGCIEERQTSASSSFSFSALTGMSPNVSDLDIDTPPTSSDATKWKPMWPEVAYYRWEYYVNDGRTRTRLTNSSPTTTGSKASSYCPRKAQTFAELTESEFDSYTDSLFPEGSTYLDLGILWGARLASPTGMFSSNVTVAPDNGASVSRHMIFMTDGEMSNSYDIQTTYGIEYHDRRITADGYSDQEARHTSRFRALCDAVKAKGIRLWVIAFGTSLTSDLTYCATSGSSFSASNATQLNAAFQEIAKQVGELRVIQ